MSSKIKIFNYDRAHDIFTVTDDYHEIAERLGLCEWNPVVWIGRLFVLDNDLGEHWFDNWDLREAKGSGFEQALIIDPHKFQDGKDGPCHTPEFRKRFWTDVLSSLELHLDLLFDEARNFQVVMQGLVREYPDDPDYRDDLIPDLEKLIAEIRNQYDLAAE